MSIPQHAIIGKDVAHIIWPGLISTKLKHDLQTYPIFFKGKYHDKLF